MGVEVVMKQSRPHTIPIEEPNGSPTVWWWKFCMRYPRNDGSAPLMKDWNAVLWRGELYFETEEEMKAFVSRWS